MHPAGLLVMALVTDRGSMFVSRLHTGIDPGAVEGWQRGSQWSPLECVVDASPLAICPVKPKLRDGTRLHRET
eukprot:scaffold268258_cov30-Prasinocladus_malaysianus.AAC.2